MKKTILVKVYYLVDIEEDELQKDFGDLDKCCNAVVKNSKIGKYNMKFNSVASLLLEQDKMNVGKCKKCGCWISDREKTNFVEGLNIGAMVNGEMLCDECLPDDHLLRF